MKVKIGLKCSESGDINYTTTKNAKTQTEKLELKKFCPRLKKHTLHKEVKLKSQTEQEPMYSKRNLRVQMQVSSSNGRAPVSKTDGWGFESLLACQRDIKVNDDEKTNKLLPRF